jgi:phosphonate transport system permease protein
MLPPEWSYLDDLLRPLWDTLNIATLGTVLALGLAVPVAVAAARNTTPHPVLRAPALLVIVASRSINSLIWALLLVAILGPGMVAGVLAIALRSIGFIAKLLYEAMEEIDPAPVAAVTATGASRWQTLDYAVTPQVLPAFAGIAVFRWDVNIREATVLGLVGAGGIGLEIDAAVAALQWSRVAVLLLAVFALVLLSESVSARVRSAVT